jgi:ribonuclease P protein component
MLSKARRLSSRDLERFKGLSVTGNSLSLRYRNTGSRQQSRFSVVVSKKTCKQATTRNRLRRQLYSLLGKQKALVKKGYHVVIYVNTIVNKNTAEVKNELNELLEKANIVGTEIL